MLMHTHTSHIHTIKPYETLVVYTVHIMKVQDMGTHAPPRVSHT